MILGPPGGGQNQSNLPKVGFGKAFFSDFCVFSDLSLKIMDFAYFWYQNLLYFWLFFLGPLQVRLFRFSLVLQEATMQIIL